MKPPAATKAGFTFPPECECVVEDLTVVAPCVKFTLYLRFTDGGGVQDFYQRAREELGGLTHCYITRGPQRISEKTDAKVMEALQGLDKSKNMKQYYWQFRSARQGVTGDSLEISIRGVNTPNAVQVETMKRNFKVLYEDQKMNPTRTLPVSMMSLSFRPDHPLCSPEKLLQWVLSLKCVNASEFISGSCGYALNDCGDGIPTRIAEQMGYRLIELAAAYPGIDHHANLYDMQRYESTITQKHGRHLPSSKRVSWLTLLSDEAIEYLGGRRFIGEQLSTYTSIHIHDLAHGILIQIGDRPSIHEVSSPSHGDEIAPYKAVAKLIRPVRVNHENRQWDAWYKRWLDYYDDSFYAGCEK